jgi:hypothetical protein
MPWLAVAYDNKELKAKCVMARWGCVPMWHFYHYVIIYMWHFYSNGALRYDDLLDVEGIPTLALFGPDGALITEEGTHNAAVPLPCPALHCPCHVAPFTRSPNSRRKRP